MDILIKKTPEAWVKLALERFDEVLCDHAHCEKKAAASAMSLVNGYPGHDKLVRRMVKLAQEELRHFTEVHRLIVERGLSLHIDRGDPYAKALMTLIRPQKEHRLVDRLLIASLIEARSCERLALIAEHHPDPGIAKFYAALATAEAGHHRLFVDLAGDFAESDEIDKRLADLAEQESSLISAMPIEARIH